MKYLPQVSQRNRSSTCFSGKRRLPFDANESGRGDFAQSADVAIRTGLPFLVLAQAVHTTGGGDFSAFGLGLFFGALLLPRFREVLPACTRFLIDSEDSTIPASFFNF